MVPRPEPRLVSTPKARHCYGDAMRFIGTPGNFWLHDLFWLLIVIALVAGVFLVVRLLLQHQSSGVPGGPRPHPGAQQALAELDLRYARGEVERSEYLLRRADLLGMPPPDLPSAASPAPPHRGPRA